MKRSRWIVSVPALLALTLALGFVLARDEASANQPNAGLEFTLHVDGCSTVADYKGGCVVTQGSTFVASVSLDAIPYPYDAMAVTIGYSGVGSKDNADIVWPDCVLFAVSPPNGTYVNAGCAIGLPPATSSTYTGTVFTASFNCNADGELHLIHSPSDTLLIDYYGKTSTEAGSDMLNIDCAPATATPVPTPTPDAVGGVAFSTSGGDGGGGNAIAFAGVLALAAGSGLGYAGWRARTRRGG